MVTDAITLRLIYAALNKFQANQGDIDSIVIESKSNESDVSKSFNFANLEQLKELVTKYIIVDWENLECHEMHFFTLKKFNVTVKVGENRSRKNIVQLDGSQYRTDSKNINRANMLILNDKYLKSSNEILGRWNNVQVNEYIKVQRAYIDCGYIEIYFADEIEKLKALYKKYKKA